LPSRLGGHGAALFGSRCRSLFVNPYQIKLDGNQLGRSGHYSWYQSEESTEICVRLPCKVHARDAGCSCCCATCVASVVAQRVRAIAAWLVLDSLAVVFLVWRTLASKSSSGEVLPESFSVGSGGKLFAVVLVRVSLRTVSRSTVPWWFWWRFSQDLLVFFPGSPFVASGGGSSQECSVFISGHRYVDPMVRSVPFGWAAFWFCWRQSELLTGVSRVVIGNRILCRVLPAIEWVAGWLVSAVSRDKAVAPRFPIVIGLLSRRVFRSRQFCYRDALPGHNKGCRGALPVAM
ncbi:hypothetical protein Taro_041659, partial [Colocasia esculenta]|nr:hypothetical protein [Colocasia esculenta]